MMYAVKCYRSAASVFGAGKAWLIWSEGEEAGEVMVFNTMALAQEKATEMNDKIQNFRIHYEAKEFTGNGGTMDNCGILDFRRRDMDLRFAHFQTLKVPTGYTIKPKACCNFS